MNASHFHKFTPPISSISRAVINTAQENEKLATLVEAPLFVSESLVG